MQRIDAAQQAAVASSQNGVKCYERMFERGDKTSRAGSSGFGGGTSGPTEQEINFNRKK